MSTKLRIGLILQGNSSWMGGVEYSKNLIKALYALPAELQSAFEVVPISSRKLETENYRDMPTRFEKELRENVTVATASVWRRVGRRLLPNIIQMPSFLSEVLRLGIDFVYPYARIQEERQPIGSAAWIPDFQYKHLPEFYRPDEIKQRDQMLAEIANRSPLVVLSSKTAANDYCRFFPSARARAEVLPFRTMAPDECYTGDAASVARKYELPERFFIVCNQFWQHKNHRIVFEALAALNRRNVRVDIVCTGALEDHRRPEYAQEVRRLLADLRIEKQVHLVGLIPRFDQIQLIRRALAVIQPSLFEGWSTVVEDARVLAKTIALSNLAVHREQDPPRSTFFDPHCCEQLADILSAWWTELSTGPHLDAERAARLENRLQLDQFARRFLAIAHAGRAA